MVCFQYTFQPKFPFLFCVRQVTNKFYVLELTSPSPFTLHFFLYSHLRSLFFHPKYLVSTFVSIRLSIFSRSYKDRRPSFATKSGKYLLALLRVEFHARRCTILQRGRYALPWIFHSIPFYKHRDPRRRILCQSIFISIASLFYVFLSLRDVAYQPWALWVHLTGFAC